MICFCLPLTRRDWYRTVVVVIASGLLANEVLDAGTIFGVPDQIRGLESNAGIADSGVQSFLSSQWHGTQQRLIVFLRFHQIESGIKRQPCRHPQEHVRTYPIA
uniref:Uncharacterized protein n=1 Tax=Cacopsylla melanoneura TaxID=428564 RepID=A0A8D9A4E6_9HEMI